MKAQPREAALAVIDTSPEMFRRLFAQDTARQRAFMRGYGSFGEDPLRTLRNWMLTPACDAVGPNGTHGTGVRNPLRRMSDGFQEVLSVDRKAWVDIYRALNWLAGQFWMEVRHKGDLHDVDNIEAGTSRLALEAGEAVSQLVESFGPNSDGGRKVTPKEARAGLDEIQDVRMALNDVEAWLSPIAGRAAA